jgi:hypothetical protein
MNQSTKLETIRLVVTHPLIRKYAEQVCITAYLQTEKEKWKVIYRPAMEELISLLRQSLMLNIWMHDAWYHDEFLKQITPDEYRDHINQAIDRTKTLLEQYPAVRSYLLAPEPRSLFS